MEIDVTKYTTLRKALAESTDDIKDIDMVDVKPKRFPLKKQHAPDVLAAAMEILDDPLVMKGITPMDTITSLAAESEDKPGPEVILYVLVCYAVAIQQKWIVYSTLLNKYILNHRHKEAVEYTQDKHGEFFKLH